MIPQILQAGWYAYQAFSAYQRSNTKEGSSEDIAYLRRLTEALYEDNQRLIKMTADQEKQISALKRQLIGVFVFSLLLLVPIALLALKH